MPSFLSLPKKSMPGWMLSNEPPLASAVAQTALKAALALVGSPLRATLFLYSGLSRSASDVGQLATFEVSQPIET